MLDRLKNKTILLVEDERIIRENIASMLSFFFKEVYTAIDGYDGLDKYEIYLPDVVMTDIRMPNMGGFELIEELIKRESKAFTIIVSAHTDTDLLIKAIKENVDRYLIKPITEDELLEALQAYLNKIDKEESPKIYLDKNIIFDCDNKNLIIDDIEVHLNKKEYLLLKLLSSNQNKIFSYEEIENLVWGGLPMSLSAIRSVVRDLRKKIGEGFIVNISGSGYRIK